MPYLALALHGLLGAVFLISSVSKVRGAAGEFVTSVGELGVLPPRAARPVALAVIGAEFAIWVLLAVPARQAAIAGFSLAAALLAVFAVGIRLSLARRRRVPCRCFGTSTVPLGDRHVVRNVALAALAVAGAATSNTGGGADFAASVVAVLSGATLGWLVSVLDDLLDLFRPTPVRSDP